MGMARAAVRGFELSADVLAFDTTHFDTHIATTTSGEWARRGHAKSKRSDRFGLASETGHVPLLHRTYPGSGSDQAVLGSCLPALGKLHDALGDAGPRRCRTLVREASCSLAARSFSSGNAVKYSATRISPWFTGTDRIRPKLVHRANGWPGKRGQVLMYHLD